MTFYSSLVAKHLAHAKQLAGLVTAATDISSRQSNRALLESVVIQLNLLKASLLLELQSFYSLKPVSRMASFQALVERLNHENKPVTRLLLQLVQDEAEAMSEFDQCVAAILTPQPPPKKLQPREDVIAVDVSIPAAVFHLSMLDVLQVTRWISYFDEQVTALREISTEF